MPFIADLHIHSKHSLATSKDMDIPTIAKWAKVKGISMMGTGDFTHPLWLGELKDRLEKTEYGVYGHNGISFILSAEVANIYFKAGKTRKVHNIILSPSVEIVEEINDALAEFGALASNGRPILNLECSKMARLLFGIDPEVVIIPSHAWTPHFGIFGSNSGFDSCEECFEEETPKIFSIETGLSSDPGMNRRWSGLDRFCLISNSDSHSPSKIGREANVFKGKVDYRQLVDILKKKNSQQFLYTIEFFPEEGKYHWNGHRACKVRLSPKESKMTNDVCPVCGKKVTVGVMDRVESLADREEGYVPDKGPSFKRIVPLAEIIADALKVKADSVAAEKEYFQLIKNFGSEFNILLDVPEDQIKEHCPARIAHGIINTRKGNVDIEPGYDGEFGRIRVIKEDEGTEKQLRFF